MIRTYHVSPADEEFCSHSPKESSYLDGRIILKWFIKKQGEGMNLIHFAQYTCRSKGGIVVDTVIKWDRINRSQFLYWLRICCLLKRTLVYGVGWFVTQHCLRLPIKTVKSQVCTLVSGCTASNKTVDYLEQSGMVQWLGYLALTQEARVRFPVPEAQFFHYLQNIYENLLHLYFSLQYLFVSSRKKLLYGSTWFIIVDKRSLLDRRLSRTFTSCSRK